MSTPVEYQRLKERIAALADEWESGDFGTDRMCAHELRALLDEERA